MWRTTSQSRADHSKRAISIHVLRVEDDFVPLKVALTHTYFNPRPPCGGRLCLCVLLALCQLFQSTSSVWRTTTVQVVDGIPTVFQSTSSVWRTTWILQRLLMKHLHFNPRPPCGGRQYTEDELPAVTNFNPRPPCGGRQYSKPLLVASCLFQSTSSVWRTTLMFRAISAYGMISIHVLRVEDDPKGVHEI